MCVVYTHTTTDSIKKCANYLINCIKYFCVPNLFIDNKLMISEYKKIIKFKKYV